MDESVDRAEWMRRKRVRGRGKGAAAAVGNFEEGGA